jgi:hypothetical protein
MTRQGEKTQDIVVWEGRGNNMSWLRVFSDLYPQLWIKLPTGP